MKKRILSLILAFAMAATLAPATALVGSSESKAAVTADEGKVITLVGAGEHPNGTGDLTKPAVSEASNTLNVTVRQGGRYTVYLKSDAPWSTANSHAGTADSITFTNVASDSANGTLVGVGGFTFWSMDKDGNSLKDNTNGTGHVASVATLDFNVDKDAVIGQTYTIRYKGTYSANHSPASAPFDLDDDGNDDDDDFFTVNVTVLEPDTDWFNFTVSDTTRSASSIAVTDGLIYDSAISSVAPTSRTITIAQSEVTSAYTATVKSSNDPFTLDEVSATLVGEGSAAAWVVNPGTAISGASRTKTITIPANPTPGVYWFKVTQTIGTTVGKSIRFGIRVGEGTTITLDPKGGEIYDAEFTKEGNIYIGSFGKNVDAFTSTKSLPIPIREDAIFDGWYQENTNNMPASYPINTGNSGVGFYAKWIDNTKTLPTITLASGVPGLANASTGTIKLGDKLASKTNVLERQGYNLLGWSVRPDANIAMYETMATITVDMIKTIQAANNNNTLYAVWSPKTFTITFKPGIPADEKLSEYSADSMPSITWSTDEWKSLGDWHSATWTSVAKKYHIWGYRFIGWSRELGSTNTGGDASKIVLNVSDIENMKEYDNRGNSYNVIDIADLQNPSGNNITLYATWSADVASYITLKEETGKELNDIHKIGDEAPERAGRVGYFVEEWVEGTDKWLPAPAGDYPVNKENAVLTPKFREEGITYNMIVAETRSDDYALNGQATGAVSNIGEIQESSHLVTFSADTKTVLLPNRKTTSEVATFVGYEAWVESTYFGTKKGGGDVTEKSPKDDVSGWTKLPGIYKGSFNAVEIIKAIDKENPAFDWDANTSTGVVFFSPVWKYNLKDAVLTDTGNVNVQDIVVNYGTSLATIQNELSARFYVTVGGVLTPITRPNVSAGITLSKGSYNSLKAGRYDLSATIYPRDTVSTNAASFTQPVTAQVRNKLASGFTETAVVATGFTPIAEINLAAGANVQDILAALAQKYRVEVSGDNGAKYKLELAEVSGATLALGSANANAVEWKWGGTSQDTTNYGAQIVTTSTLDNNSFNTAFNNGGNTGFTNASFRFALPVDTSLKLAGDTAKNAGNLEYIGLNTKGNLTLRNRVDGNRYVIVEVNVGSGNRPTPPTPAEPEKEEVNPDRPAIAAGPVYVLYNKNDGDHYYTADKAQRDVLAAIGWQVDKVTFYTPSSTDPNAKPVYVIYNPNSGEHHYTMSKGEVNARVKDGWQNHGVQFYAYSKNSSLGTPIYRLFNPNATDAGSHYITGSKGVYNKLGSIGWQKEGVGFRAVKAN